MRCAPGFSSWRFKGIRAGGLHGQAGHVHFAACKWRQQQIEFVTVAPRHTELASQRSTFTPKNITTNNSYASFKYLLPPTSNYNFLSSTMQFVGPWQGPNIAAQPLWRPLPIPPTAQISIGVPGQGTIGITPARIGSGVIGSVVEKPFANFNSAAVNGLGGVHYSANTFGNKWTWERDTYQLIDLSSGRVLREWDGGTVINLRYGSNGHLRLGGQNFFMNQGGSFQNNGH